MASWIRTNYQPVFQSLSSGPSSRFFFLRLAILVIYFLLSSILLHSLILSNSPFDYSLLQRLPEFYAALLSFVVLEVEGSLSLYHSQTTLLSYDSTFHSFLWLLILVSSLPFFGFKKKSCRKSTFLVLTIAFHHSLVRGTIQDWIRSFKN